MKVQSIKNNKFYALINKLEDFLRTLTPDLSEARLNPAECKSGLNLICYEKDRVTIDLNSTIRLFEKCLELST